MQWPSPPRCRYSVKPYTDSNQNYMEVLCSSLLLLITMFAKSVKEPVLVKILACACIVVFGFEWARMYWFNKQKDKKVNRLWAAIREKHMHNMCQLRKVYDQMCMGTKQLNLDAVRRDKRYRETLGWTATGQGENPWVGGYKWKGDSRRSSCSWRGGTGDLDVDGDGCRASAPLHTKHYKIRTHCTLSTQKYENSAYIPYYLVLYMQSVRIGPRQSGYVNLPLFSGFQSKVSITFISPV